MHELTAKPRTGVHSPVLASLFFKAAGFARADALLTAPLCGGTISWVFAILGSGRWSAVALGLILGFLGAFVAFVVIAPESLVTVCLVSARKCLLDNQVTCAQYRQMRKQCLRKSLLY